MDPRRSPVTEILYIQGFTMSRSTYGSSSNNFVSLLSQISYTESQGDRKISLSMFSPDELINEAGIPPTCFLYYRFNISLGKILVPQGQVTLFYKPAS